MSDGPITDCFLVLMFAHYRIEMPRECVDGVCEKAKGDCTQLSRFKRFGRYGVACSYLRSGAVCEGIDRAWEGPLAVRHGDIPWRRH